MTIQLIISLYWYVTLIVLRSSGISQKSGALIVRYSQKKECISCVFYCFENPSIACNLCTIGSIQKAVFSKMYLSKWALQSNLKMYAMISSTCEQHYTCSYFAFYNNIIHVHILHWYLLYNVFIYRRELTI